MTSYRNITAASSSTAVANISSSDRAPDAICMIPRRVPGGMCTDTATTANLNTSWASDFLLAASAFNPPSLGEPTYSPAWSSLSERTREKLAHARLIDGDYGVNLEEPCETCQRSTRMIELARPGHQRQCRAYIRSLKVRPRALGVQCSTCRANGSICSLVAKEPKPKKRNKGGKTGRQKLSHTDAERRARKNELRNSLR
jgi:hypothetical protein